MYILGISAYYHDSAAALLCDGRVIAAAQEERFTRVKHDDSFPEHAIAYCLEHANISLQDISYFAFYDKPFLKFERLLETYLAFAPKGFRSFCMAMPLWLREKLFQKDLIIKELQRIDPAVTSVKDKIMFSEHHFSHAASAYYASPYNDAVVLTLDGVGEWATTTVSIGRGNDLYIHKEIHFPHSLGLLYSAFTYYTGFKVNSGEYKVMGLAPYGVPKYKDLILEHIIDVKEDGSFRMDMSYFNYCTGFTMTNKKFSDLFGQPVRNPDTDPLTQFHMDIAASVQAVTEEIVLRLTRALAAEYKMPNLCLAGGVALNCVANGKVLRDQAFKNIWVQPASGDAGGAIGSALALWHMDLGKEKSDISLDYETNKSCDLMSGAYLGPAFSQDEIEEDLKNAGASYDVLDDQALFEKTAQALVDGKAIGWHQGRMEFGPRALGNRSILGDPRSSVMQKILNLKVKYRESFRPFAPSVLSEYASEWFDINKSDVSPYMLLVANVASQKCHEMSEEEQSLFGIDKLNVSRSEVPAVTHVDYSARIQTVHAHTNPRYHALIEAFYQKSGCPMVVNTSFNVRGEPIVCTPKDAFRCFMGTDIEVLVVGNCFLRKEDQNTALQKNYKDSFELD
ncbi:MAG: carbamoyltransferase [Alphaproteobacteria bacterium]|jgi:carbamoyltransferase|nr:carbamoyltransferase [Alphaproteobacteria bacterium]MDP7222677.1 carbamoyltransferase [Alphaproteobacteria bacterium]